jgi:predicted transcriptional regulator
LWGFSPPHFVGPAFAAQTLIRAAKTSYTAKRYVPFALKFSEFFEKILTNIYKYCIFGNMEENMPVSTVNISFQTQLLDQIDEIANDEARTRSELIREAVRMYIERKKEWQTIFAMGKKIGETLKITEDDVMEEVKKYRKSKNK